MLRFAEYKLNGAKQTKVCWNGPKTELLSLRISANDQLAIGVHSVDGGLGAMTFTVTSFTSEPTAAMALLLATPLLIRRGARRSAGRR